MKNNKTRVVIVSDTLYPWFIGGKERRLHSFATTAENSEFEIIFATMKWWEGEAPKGHIALSRKYEIYKNGRRSIFSALGFALSCFKVASLRPDLVEADQIPVLHLWPLKIVCRIRKVPLSVTWHEVWSKPYWLKYLGPLGYLAALVEKWSLALPDRFIAVSDMTRSRLIAEGVSPAKISLIENTLDISGIRTAETSLPRTDLLFVGRLISHKRIDLLLSTVAELKAQGILVSLSIVGTGPEMTNLQSKMFELNISEQITFYADGLESHDVWGLMKKCPVFVLPSEREGYGIAVQEALLVGATVLVSNHPDNAARELINQTSKGRIVGEQTAQAWADEISNLIATGIFDNAIKQRDRLEDDNSQDNFVSDYQYSWNLALAAR
jgi:glycosyltransferase involved in cell wall biosynthesis